MEDQEFLLRAKDAAVAAVLPLRDTLLAAYGNVENTVKSDATVVTKLDIWAEDEIKNSLKQFDATIGYYSEESGEEGDINYRWVIDPIDGTEQFIRGIPFCANMLCLVKGKELLVSVIYNFVTDELYWAVKGGGAWLGTKPLRVSKRTLEASFVELRPTLDTESDIAFYKSIADSIKSAVRMNCSAYAMTLTAQGSIEARVTTGSKGGPWDYAPGALLILEAGGLVEHRDGSTYNYLDTSSFVAGNKAVVEFVRSLPV